MRKGSSGKSEEKYQKDAPFLDFAIKFSTDAACRELLEKRRWPDGPICPRCGETRHYKLKGKSTRPGVYKCAGCLKPYTVTVGTFMEGTHIPLPRWFAAMYWMAASKKSMSAHQMHRMLGVCYESAWYMGHRIRYAQRERDKRKTMRGIVEADETFIGGKKKRGGKPVRGAVGKAPVMGIVQRNKHVVLKPIRDTSKATIQGLIRDYVYGRAKVFTDDATSYIGLRKKYDHRKVVHSKGEYARREGKVNIHTNTIEGVFSLVKRAIYGTYHHVSVAKLPLYCDEWAFRYSHRMVKDSVRFERMLDKPEGRLRWYFKKGWIGDDTLDMKATEST